MNEQIYAISLNEDEALIALKDVLRKVNKILFVYEQSLNNDNYHFRSYVYSVAMYIASCNSLLHNRLTFLLVDLNTLLTQTDLTKAQIRKIVLDDKHQLQDMINEGV